MDLQQLPVNRKNGKPVIVCVDDEEMILSSLRFQLKKFFKDFFQIETATNAEVALEIVKDCLEREIDLPVIISDHIMPGIKGDELLIQVAKLTEKTKKIMLTGQANADAVGNALNHAGLYRFIAKPWDPQDLNLTLQEAVRSYYLDKSLEEKNKELEKALLFNHRTGLPNLQSLFKKLQSLQGSKYHLTLIKLENYLPCMRAFGLDLYHSLVNKFIEIYNQHISEQLYHLYEDEFALISQKPEDILYSQLNAFRLLLKSDLICVEDIFFQVSLTIVTVSSTEQEASEIYQKARIILISAYEKSAKTVVQHFFDMAETDLYAHNSKWGKKLKYSLETKRIIPFFQGVLNNRTGKIEKFECLARMVEGEVIYPPSKFLEIARSTGTLKSITRLIIEKALKVFSNNNYSFSINITEAELDDRNFVKFIESSLAYHKIHPSRLIFEVLESVTLYPESQNVKTLSELKELGCKISIDDFGVSNSNFSRLLEFYPDYIKIDGKFIKNLLNNKNAYVITKVIKELALNIGAMTVAEFVCDREIQNVVNSLGIDFSQGYYIMEPSAHLPTNGR